VAEERCPRVHARLSAAELRREIPNELGRRRREKANARLPREQPGHELQEVAIVARLGQISARYAVDRFGEEAPIAWQTETTEEAAADTLFEHPRERERNPLPERRRRLEGEEEHSHAHHLRAFARQRRGCRCDGAVGLEPARKLLERLHPCGQGRARTARHEQTVELLDRSMPRGGGRNQATERFRIGQRTLPFLLLRILRGRLVGSQRSSFHDRSDSPALVELPGYPARTTSSAPIFGALIAGR
jgi:hypothetical protein